MRHLRYDVPEWGDASGNNHEYQVKKILSLSIYWSWNAKTKTAHKHKICPKILDENHPIAEHQYGYDYSGSSPALFSPISLSNSDSSSLGIG